MRLQVLFASSLTCVASLESEGPVMSQTARRDKQGAAEILRLQVLFASSLTCVASLESEGTVRSHPGVPTFFRGFFSLGNKPLKSNF